MELFQSTTYGPLDLLGVIRHIKYFLEEDPKLEYNLVIGTDSQEKIEGEKGEKVVNLVTAVVVHRKGFGGKYFWQRKKVKDIHTLRQKIYAETMTSLDFAKTFVHSQDVIAPLYKKGLDDLKRIKISRIIIAVIGIYILYWGLWYNGSDDIWDYMAVSGAIYFSGAFSLLLAGLYWKKASSTGALLALIAGFSAILGLGPVQQLINITIPSARMGLISITLTVIAMIAGSLAFPDKKLLQEAQ